MPGQTSITNGKKGGRPKGSKASHTLAAEKFRQDLIESVGLKSVLIIDALISKAIGGETAAIREVLDRVLGKRIDLEIEPNMQVIISQFIEKSKQNKTD